MCVFIHRINFCFANDAFSLEHLRAFWAEKKVLLFLMRISVQEKQKTKCMVRPRRIGAVNSIFLKQQTEFSQR